jgi:hypothetical protein
MKNVMIIDVHYEDFKKRVVPLGANHELVRFCQRWVKAHGQAYIDAGNDDPKLLDAWTQTLELPEIPLPCRIHHTVFVLVY